MYEHYGIIDPTSYEAAIMENSKLGDIDIKSDDVNYYIYGPPNSGKTKFLSAYGKYLIDNSVWVYMLSAEGLLKLYYDAKFGKNRELMSSITKCDVLIVDRFGEESYTVQSSTPIFSNIFAARPTGNIISSRMFPRDVGIKYNGLSFFKRWSNSGKLKIVRLGSE